MLLGRLLQAGACIGLGLFGGILATQRLVGQPIAPPAQPPLPGRDWQSFAPIVKRVMPGVVTIESKGREKHVAGEDTDPGFGSGIIIDPSGIVLTANHVVADLDEVEVTLQDGRKFATADIRRDPKVDVALVKFDTKEAVPFVEFGDSDLMEVGDRILAFGTPFGLTGSVTSGIISAKSRNNLKLNQAEDFIQTDAAVNPGNSGGPIVNMDGKVIGLTAAIKTRTGGFQGVALAVSSNLARKTAADLIKNGGAKRNYFGVSVRELDAASARNAGYKGSTGAVVTRVDADSPAGKAGVRAGDVITKINGRVMTDASDLRKAVAALPAGQTADVLLWRGGKLYIGKVKVEEERQANRPVLPAVPAVLPPAQPLSNGGNTADLGLAVTDLTAETAKQLKLPSASAGAMISGVARDSAAEKAGLARGLVVLKVDKTPVTSAITFEQALRKADPEKGAVLHVLKPNGEVDLIVLPVGK